MPAATQREALVLSLTGGGFRGYFTALVLAEMEAKYNARCRDIFDLFAGTSIGGILALGLAQGVPAASIARAMASRGRAIFPQFFMPTVRQIFGPPYRADALDAIVAGLLGADIVDQPISTAGRPVMVVTASPGLARTEVLASWDKGDSGRVSFRDAALSTSAAPTYFPAHRARKGGVTIDLIDGGVVANAPDAMAIEVARRHLGADDVSMLAIGTCGQISGAPTGEYPGRWGYPGALFWLGGKGIVGLMMSIQEQRGVEAALADLGREHYLRIDRAPSVEQARSIGLAKASKTAVKTLEALASAAWQDFLAQQNHRVVMNIAARAARVSKTPPNG